MLLKAVITADIVNSTKLEKSQEKKLINTLSNILKAYKFEFYRGAKGIIRFNGKDRQEIKTEYLVIGTLLSILAAVITGLILKEF